MRARAVPAVLLLVAVFFAACGDDGEELNAPPGDNGADATATTDDTFVDGGEPLELTAELSGSAERPGPGDPDGTGTASVTIDPIVNELCFRLTADGIDEPTAAHIHRGGPQEPGPIVVEITAPSGGSSEGCTPVEEEILNEIASGPASFYVNVHNAEYPDGAIRGQLAAA